MSPAMTGQQRAVLADLATVLLPGGSGLPSGSEIAIDQRPIDLALRARSDLAIPIATILDRIAGQSAETALSDLQHTSPDDFERLIQFVLAAYCMDESVWEKLGYTGQQAQSLPRDGFGAEELALAMMETPQRFRRPPDFTEKGC